MLVIKQHRIYRADVINNRHLLYVFGDNMERVGFGGQAKEIRGEQNAHGIPTKRKAAHGGKECYFHDDEADAFTSVLEGFSTLKRRYNVGQYRGLVWPSDGIGTGLAELDKRAPKLLQMIEEMTKGLYDAH